ncbi:thiamine pyrophosphate-binding protein [Nocardia sp. BMG51109]|uniref:thiamine pyrophosphate-binding protein n=1 Tax=Nocardia sp. BMG51109 TaxID=1056816 RepID=UPI000463514E|nr:thiamine pyrophosphate-binding protein [Nocardia sp. BMG51109]
MNVATALLRRLRAIGIEHIFGIVGREASAISFNEIPDIHFVLTRHEFTAGVAACSMSRFTGTPQVSFATIGPGAANLMTAVATATLDRYPLIAIVAHHETYEIAHNNAHQCIDSVSMAKPISKYAHLVTGPDDLFTSLDRALNIAQTPPAGPAFLAVPIDILAAPARARMAYEKPSSAPVAPSSATVDGPPSPDLRKIVAALRSCSNPIIAVGDAALKSGLTPDIVRMAERSNIPVVTTYAAKGALPGEHPLDYGAITPYMDSILEFPALDTLFEPIDFVLLICYDPAEHLYPRLWTRGRQKTVARLSDHKDDSGLSVFDIDAVHPLREAIDFIAGNSAGTRREPHSIDKLRDRIDELFNDSEELPIGVKPTQVLRTLHEHLEGFILASDVGLHRHVSALFFKASRPLDFVTSAGLSSFGTGMGLGIGAKLANPDRPVVIIAGDGGFHSVSGDLETVVRLGLDVLIIIMNNSASSLIQRYESLGNRPENPGITTFGTVDFAALAQANGCRGLRAESLAELRESIAIGTRSPGPTLVDVRIEYPDLYMNGYSTNYHTRQAQ